jgi:multidrug efflux system outer membrane protein
MRSAMIVLLLALIPTAAAAQTPTPQPQTPIVKMEFDEVIRQAAEKNPNTALAASNIQRSETLVKQARAVTLPIVLASVNNSTLDAARGFSGGVFQPQNQFVFSASAGMSVLAASRWAAVGQARDQVTVSEKAAEEIRQQVVVAAAQAYLAVITLRRQVEVSLSALETARAHYEYATKRFEGGAGSRLNQLRAAQVMSAEESRLEEIRLAMRAAQEALGVIVVSPTPVDAGAEPVFDMTGTMDDNTWRTARPDLVTQAAIRRAAERVVADSWRDWVPNVNVSFDPTLLTPAGLFQPARTWRFSVSSTYPVFEGGQRKINLKLREISLDQSRIELTQLEIRAQSEVRQAQEAVRARERAYVAARRAADEATEVLQITTTAFEVGATTNLEVIDAQRSLRLTLAEAELAQDAARRAKLDLLVAIGRFK